MKKLLTPIAVTIIMAAIMCGCGCGTKSAPITLRWTPHEGNPATGVYPQSYTLTNISGKELGSDWILYFTQLPYLLPEQAPSLLKLEVIASTYYKIYPTELYEPIAAGGHLTLTIDAFYRLFKDCQAPEGAFIVTADGRVMEVKIEADIIPIRADGEQIYGVNSVIQPYRRLGTTDIIPAPKSVTAKGGISTVSKNMVIEYPAELASEARMLSANLAKDFGAAVGEGGGTKIILMRSDDKSLGDEGYTLQVSENNITIGGATSAGVFYGTQTLLSMLKGGSLPCEIENMEIKDYPDVPYRGQMLDIVRTYIKKKDVKEFIDILASYKLNVLHYHFSDDEGWRIEIPGLPELTEIGGRRGYTLDERDMLFPAYDGGPDPERGAGSGYLSRGCFIELLKYAAERHVRVIPEIESPGHARAAMRAMEARYFKYIDTDPEKAKEFLLTDFDDKSIYLSAQYYTDNVMCVGLPSVYRFMEKVIDELDKMYAEAGLRLETIHIGGDEVPDGAWTGSPIAGAYMKENGIETFDDLAEYYILRVNDILKKRDIKMAGWQELVVGRSEAFRQSVRDNISAVHCWHTIGENAALTYRLANMGYKVLFCNVRNLYLDMAYTAHTEEAGHWWGAFVDQRKSFATLPFNVYASERFDNDNNILDVSTAGKGMEHLTEAGKKNIIGLQGQLWGETIRGIDMRQMHIYPKVMGVAERGWNASPAWGESGNHREAFNIDFDRFNAIINDKELPWLLSRGVNFHIPQPGIVVREGVLYANKTIEGGEIRYTTDGSTPTAGSPLWTAPTECNADRVKARLFYLGKESVTTLWER